MAVLAVRLHPHVKGLQAEHVSLGVLWVVIPARDVPLAKKHGWLLKLAGPNGAVRPGRLHPARIGRIERQGRTTIAVVEALDVVGLAVPARVVVPPARSRVVRHVAVRGVGKHVAGVVGDDVEDDVDSLLVGGLDKVAEFLSCSKMRIHVEEILDTVAVVGRLERDLPEGRADPQGSDAEPAEVAEFALQSLERSALPTAAGAEPRVVIDPAGILGPIQWSGAGRRPLVRNVPIAVFLLAVGEAVQQQEVQNLVLPGGRGRGKRPPLQSSEVELQQAFLDFLRHGCTLDDGRVPSQPGARKAPAASTSAAMRIRRPRVAVKVKLTASMPTTIWRMPGTRTQPPVFPDAVGFFCQHAGQAIVCRREVSPVSEPWKSGRRALPGGIRTTPSTRWSCGSGRGRRRREPCRSRRGRGTAARRPRSPRRGTGCPGPA